MSCPACTPGRTGGTAGSRCEDGDSFSWDLLLGVFLFLHCGFSGVVLWEQAGGAFKGLIVYIYTHVHWETD